MMLRKEGRCVVWYQHSKDQLQKLHVSHPIRLKPWLNNNTKQFIRCFYMISLTLQRNPHSFLPFTDEERDAVKFWDLCN